MSSGVTRLIMASSLYCDRKYRYKSMAIAKGTTSYRVFLPVELKRDFKIWCFQNGTSMSAKSEKLIQDLIDSGGDSKS